MNFIISEEYLESKSKDEVMKCFSNMYDDYIKTKKFIKQCQDVTDSVKTWSEWKSSILGKNYE